MALFFLWKFYNTLLSDLKEPVEHVLLKFLFPLKTNQNRLFPASSLKTRKYLVQQRGEPWLKLIREEKMNDG